MAIVCPRCGREYDVTLFQFGRTIDCACGARVGLEKKLPLEARSGRRDDRVRFAADAMLGGLARWLRILGYDVAHDASIDDAALVRSAVEEGRRILTRDRRLPQEWRVEGIVVVEAEKPLAQLEETVERLDLAPDESRAFTRCPRCNHPLEPAGPEEVRSEVPEAVFREQDEFRRCTGCGRVYWEGSHVRRMRRRLRHLFRVT